MDKEYLEKLLLLIMPKSRLLMNELRHELISFGLEFKNEAAEALIETKIHEALKSAIEITFTSLIRDGKIK